MDADNWVRLAQDQETSVTSAQSATFAYRYAYARSADTRVANDLGQDYLIFRPGAQRFVFALCDGVSQSFYGNLAARLLGEGLAAWLGESLPASLDAAPIRDALLLFLQDFTGPTGVVVRRQDLPPDIPPMLRQVLEQKRAGGSDSTFICGRIDLPSPAFPAGRIVCAWMGDSRLRLWGPDGEWTNDLGPTFLTAQRWSSGRGPVGGMPHLFAGPLDRGGRRALRRLLVYSDGLSTLDRVSDSPSDGALAALIAAAGAAATSDDISVLEVWLTATRAEFGGRNAAPSGAPPAEAPPPLPGGTSPDAGIEQTELLSPGGIAPPPAVPAAPRPALLKPLWVAAGGVAALLVLLLGAAILLACQAARAAQATATAQVIRATTTAQAQVTATAQAVGVIATAQAQAAAIAQAIRATATAQAQATDTAQAIRATAQAQATDTAQAIRGAATAQAQATDTAQAVDLLALSQQATATAQVLATGLAGGATATVQAAATLQAATPVVAPPQATAPATATTTATATALATTLMTQLPNATQNPGPPPPGTATPTPAATPGEPVATQAPSTGRSSHEPGARSN